MARAPGADRHPTERGNQQASREGCVFAVDCDLKSFFDKVDHGELMQRLRRDIQDGRVLRLIGLFLRAGVRLPDGTTGATPAGVPQGGPLSPLLANVMLDDLDHELERRGHRFARYADDFIIVVRSKRAAERVMRSISGYIETELKLVVNQAKTKAARLSQCSFLGFVITPKRIRCLDSKLDTFKQASRCRKGYWRCSNLRVVCIAMNNEWLKQQGRPSIKEQWQKLCYPKG